MPINLFDLLFVAFLIAGILRGRKHGVSEEFLRVVKWLSLLFGCALVYRPVGALFLTTGVLDDFSAYLMAYLGAALTILLFFSLIERGVGKKLTGSDAFGRAEYYLGMGSGLVRYTCILIMGLALLNARAFTPAEVQASEKYQLEAYGSSVFPTLRNLQEMIFKQSFTGACIKQNLGFLLINSTPGDQVPPEANAPAPRPAKQLTQAHPGA